jgi:predicted ATPase
MKLQRLHIKNFKSIVDLEIVEPNPFTVFVGPNGSGKSNIFEALEFFFSDASPEAIRLFDGSDKLHNRKLATSEKFEFNFIADTIQSDYISDSYFSETQYRVLLGSGRWYSSNSEGKEGDSIKTLLELKRELYEEFRKKSTSRIFVRNIDKQKINFNDNLKLNFSASNLEKVLKRILQDEVKREEIKEWLDLFIPGFENIEIVSSELSGTDTLVMYEKDIKKPFTKDLLSDGTYNILALLTAVYQSDEPQFLCIEEPENGLTPYVIEQFVELFRNVCQEKGHYIWLNTHSPTLVRNLRADELIVVDKKQGATQIKQFKGKDYFGLRMDEAWLTNALGGGLPW